MSRSNGVITVLAVLCVLGLALYSVGLSRSRHPARPHPPLFSFPVDEIAAVLLGAASRQTVVVINVVGETGPPLVTDARSFPARRGRVESLLSNVAGLPHYRWAAETSDGSYFPTGGSRLLLFDAQEQLLGAVSVGAPTGTGDEVYYRVGEDSRVGVTDGAILFYIEQPPPFYADLRVFSRGPTAAEIVGVRLDPRGTGLFPQATYGTLDETAGAQTPVDESGDEARVLVRSILALEAAAFSDFDPRQASAESVSRVELLANDGRRWRLYIAEAERLGDFVAIRAEGPGFPTSPTERAFSYLVPRRDVEFMATGTL